MITGGDFWRDGRRRCDGMSATEGRRCFDIGTHRVEPDSAPALRYCRRHGREQARGLKATVVPA